jgi:hypothetical protein
VPFNSIAETTSSSSEITSKPKYDPMAGWLSFLLPGLGQVYQGAYTRGVTLFCAFILVACFRDGRIFLPLAALLAGFEAYRPKAKKEHWSIWERALSSYWSRYLRDRSQPQRVRKPIYAIAAILGFLGWFALFAPAIYPFEAQARMNDAADALADKVRDYRASKGILPTSLNELLKPGESDEGIKDPWGETIMIRASEDGFDLLSKGRDRQANTRDDYRYHFR